MSGIWYISPRIAGVEEEEVGVEMGGGAVAAKVEGEEEVAGRREGGGRRGWSRRQRERSRGSEPSYLQKK